MGGTFIWKHKGSELKRAEKKIKMSGDASYTNLKREKSLVNKKYKKDSYRKQALKMVTMRKEEASKYMGSKAYTEYIEIQEQLMSMPKIDLNDAEQVRTRIREYFDLMKKYGNKPTIAGLGLALGNVSRDRMKRMAANESGRVPQEVSEELQKVYLIYESLWETYMLEGDVPPISGMFIGKNQFGYKDAVEQTTVVEVKPRISAESIQAKYIGADNELPEDHNKQDE